jgi:hypothetical protein
MKREPDGDERAIDELFRRTRREASESQLARLESDAVEVAERKRREWLSPRLVWPLSIAAAAAAVYIGIAPPKARPVAIQAETTPAAAPAAKPAASPAASPAGHAAADDDELEGPELLVLVEADEYGPFDLGPLMDDD